MTLASGTENKTENLSKKGLVDLLAARLKCSPNSLAFLFEGPDMAGVNSVAIPDPRRAARE